MRCSSCTIEKGIKIPGLTAKLRLQFDLKFIHSVACAITIKTLKIGTPRLTNVAVLHMKQYDFTMQ